MQTKMTVTDERYRLGYHLMTNGGWMNDPNGFCFFQGYYHIFYQYYPYGVEWGPMHWGHARSKDMLHWETLPVALSPDEKDDGCFSGSAIEYDGKLWLVYTGHHYRSDDPEDFYEDQNLAWSEDGIHFTKYAGNPVLHTPADNTKHFRDPKVWQKDDTFYMVLGSQGTDELGRALIYSSPDLVHWQEVSVLAKSEAVKTEGYMWECPDFFHLDGQDVLLMSPQGLEKQGDLYRNLNQTGYIMGAVDPKTQQLNHEHFAEIDRGHDFYATQTMLTPDGRRIMMAWMNAWDSDIHEQADGWAGALTLPRELHIKDGKIYQSPIAEMTALRQKALLQDSAPAQEAVSLPRTVEIKLDFDEIDDNTAELLSLSDGQEKLTLSLDCAHSRLVLQRTTKDGERAAQLDSCTHLSLHLFVDKSSAEIFVNDGEVTFTERIYWQNDLSMTLPKSHKANVTIYKLATETNRY